MPQVRIHAANQFSIDEVPVPEAGPDDVLLRVLYCGICGSDLHFVADGGVRRGAGQPMALGHEFSAEVHSVGANITGLQAGDRVVMNPLGGGNFVGNGGGQGSFSRYVLARNFMTTPGLIYKIPAALGDRAGALVEPMAVSLHALRRARLAVGENLLVVGAGPIGLGITLAAKHLGAAAMVASDLSDYRLSRAAKLGASVFNASESGLQEFLVEQFGTRSSLFGPFANTHIIVETTGSAQVLKSLVELAAPGTRIVTLAMPVNPEAPFDFSPVVAREIELIGALGYGDSFEEAIGLLVASAGVIDMLVSHDFALAEFSQAFAVARNPAESAKVLVDCRR